MVRPATNAEPGTGTQYYTVANEPCRCQSRPRLPEGAQCPGEETFNHEKPPAATINGRRWRCGRDYWDSEMNDIAELVAIVRKSSWCDNREPEEGALKLRFAYERRECRTAEIDPNDPSGEVLERFTPRYQRPLRIP